MSPDAQRPGPVRRAGPGRGTGRPATATIAVKLGLLAGGLVFLLVASSVALMLQIRVTAQRYDQVLTSANDGLMARQVQVEYLRQVQEQKNVLLRGSNPKDRATYLGNFKMRDARVNQLTDALIAGTTDPELRAGMVTFRTRHQELDVAYGRAHAAFAAGDGQDPFAADRMVSGMARQLTPLIDDVINKHAERTNAQIARHKAAVTREQRITLAVEAALLVTLVAGLVLVVRRMVRPIRGLTTAAHQVAHEALPAAIARIRSLPADAAPPTLPAYQVTSRDELCDLAEAFAEVQASAISLAVEQHEAEREAAEMLINLGRRNQNLLSRLLAQVTELERSEQDPEVMATLFRLDHAATRIRRNAESMLVLAGAAQTRTFSVPVPCVEVVRAALSEIEDYARVDLYHLEDATLNGSAAADVIHLLAELIENSTHFSPPTSRVTVVGQRVPDGYRIRVIDEGVGMTHRELQEANERIQLTTQGWSDAKLLGLHVVGRLARRRGITVYLEPSAARGITATVVIPPPTLVDTPEGPRFGPVRAADTTAPLDGRHRQVPQPPEQRQAAPPDQRRAVPPPQVPRPAAVVAGMPTLPKRIRGAQLAALQLDEDDADVGFDPAPEESRWNLRSFQLDVDAARRTFDDPAAPAAPAAPPTSPAGEAGTTAFHDRSSDQGWERG